MSDHRFRQVAQLVQQAVGIQLPPAKRVMVEGRLRKRAQSLGYQGVDPYCAALFDEGLLEAEYQELVNLITTNKTDFFREAEHFELLRSTLVPNLLAGHGHPQGGPRLKVWSAACSIGAEAYTIAMVLDDMTRATRPPFRFAVLGTDIATHVLEHAERAIYPAAMLDPVPGELRLRYTLRSRDPTQPLLRIVPELRRHVRFAQLNLMNARYPCDRDVDIIFCRNVLIYFDRPTQVAIVSRLAGHLRPGGYLILGHSETAAASGAVGLLPVASTVWRRSEDEAA
ncbi:chemotaxis protein CheR [Paracraurococcus ruber]|uniref:Chemotaxis protein methyltransferase n=2 Tax=Paracraurococcus ruber TaxID=77675 RepID=A0ABS1CQH1_9PROT|nr:CheR family methyltransferase [Paracraurococcus ruber]MBK1656663.1 chemotaxis protein CheR [Paracraurococcus ruber]TDG33769.1 chemotaxis protein CheR [Paracraurococcus ruber]